MKRLSIMIKPASSLCNLRCKYCFYADVSKQREVCSYGVMSCDTVDQMLDHIFCDLERGDYLTFAFQGGEPTLAGLEYFRHFTEAVKKRRNGVNISYALQTNGILISEDWCAFLKEHNFLVGLSLDAGSQFHDANRVDAAGKGTYGRVMEVKQLLDRYGVSYNVLTVLTNSLARHPQQLWRFLNQQKIRYLQLIPCLGELDSEGNEAYQLTPARFASFYSVLFDLWYSAFQKGEYISIKLFDDIVNLLVDGSCTACGITGHCAPQLVVEADGSVYPCDFYVLDRFRLGNLKENQLMELLQSDEMSAFLLRPRDRLAICSDCPFRRICNGGCARMQQEVCGSPDAKECGYRIFLEEKIQAFSAIAARERRARQQRR